MNTHGVTWTSGEVSPSRVGTASSGPLPFMAEPYPDLRKQPSEAWSAHRAPNRGKPETWNTTLEAKQAMVRNVLLLHNAGYSRRAISEDLSYPLTTVHRIITRWENR